MKKNCVLAVIVLLTMICTVGCGEKDASQQTSETTSISSSASSEVDEENIYLSAKEYLEQKDYASAIKELEKIIDYKDVNKLLQDARYEYGITLYDKSKYAEAIEMLEKTGDYKDAVDYLDKSYMEQKYEDFDYKSFSTEGDDSTETMTNKEIREYMEECQESAYDKWYLDKKEEQSIEFEKYKIDGKLYKIVSWGGQGNFTEYDICYLDEPTNKIHVSLSPDFIYMDIAEKTPMYLSIGEKDYCNYTSKQEQEYAAKEQEEQEQTTEPAEYYSTQWAYSDTLAVCVYYAYVGYDSKQQTNAVVVSCSIANTGNSDITFTACDLFSLEYNGVITTARENKNDYSILAPGGQIDGNLMFNCPAAERAGDTLKMTMRMRDTQIHLGPVPQTEEEQHQLPGTYMHSSPSFDTIFTIIDGGNGRYAVIWVSDTLGIHEVLTDVSLNEANGIVIKNGYFKWNPDECLLYDDDSSQKTEYKKQNPIK